ncbi:MAG: O-antigen ligase family protein [Flavobacteriales bacterium]|mgnify:CR=1 FL=1|nr:O-antigen ligase family protein [Flavobacteriales bacterium]MCC6939525.1 O-antigen ligase family protein [Flavobacteriales bacterium]
MLTFLRGHWQLIFVMLVWLGVGFFLQQAVFALLPLSVFFFKQRDLWPEILFGLLIVLVLSDMEKDLFLKMIVFKSAKNFYILAVAGIFLLETNRFMPLSRVFNIFLPFFLYSIFPLLFSNSIIVAVEKTISYALMFMVVPNYVLYCYRRQGWSFFRNLIFFMTAILLFGFVLQAMDPVYSHVMGRFRGMFGNPNGMAIYCFLFIMLASVVNTLNRNLFSFRERLVIFGTIFYFLLMSGSRASLTSAAIFLIFHRFFASSPMLGFVGLVGFVLAVELVSSNLEMIITYFGLAEYFRLNTLENGSGRYFAWDFAWQHIQRFFVFGGGFANDETIMRKYRLYLESQGHQGGVHNTYLSMWLNVGIVGLTIFLRSLLLLFIKASKLVPMSLAIMFATLFSLMYESWLVGSLNPYTIVLLMIMTVVTEPEIANWQEENDGEPQDDGEDGAQPIRMAVA